MQDNFSEYEQTIYKNIGSNIKIYRERANISQELLAEKVNCSREFINRIENNKDNPGLPLLIKISYILDIPVEKLFVKL